MNQNRMFSALLAAMAGLGDVPGAYALDYSSPATLRVRPDRGPTPPTNPRRPDAHTCPDCGAKPGRECRGDRRGRRFHKARAELTRKIP
jgi:hypothetical protein